VILREKEDQMAQMIDNAPAGRSLLDMVERASLFALLQQAMAHHKQRPGLPGRLRDDVGMPPCSRSDDPPVRD